MTNSGRKPARAKHSRTRSLRSERPRIAIIGAGRLGTAIGRALRGAGYQIELVVTQRAATARRAAKLISRTTKSARARDLYSGVDELARLGNSQLILISTPDDAVSQAAEQLTRWFHLNQRQQERPAPARRVALHTSGALPSSVLNPLRSAGFVIGSLHPLISIADAELPLEVFENSFFCVEGQRGATRVARTIVQDLKGNSFTIPTKSKSLYHAAAVMSSGHVVALLDIAIEMLARCGLPPGRAREVLLPLFMSNSANLAGKKPGEALTGPFARGDAATVRKHLAAMKSEKLEQAAAVYALLGKRALKLANSKSDRSDQISRLLTQLQES
jgi:predicted short-subunit dehydrogenase-like oxidoreductase (DUF2520 family)